MNSAQHTGFPSIERLLPPGPLSSIRQVVHAVMNPSTIESTNQERPCSVLGCECEPLLSPGFRQELTVVLQIAEGAISVIRDLYPTTLTTITRSCLAVLRDDQRIRPLMCASRINRHHRLFDDSNSIHIKGRFPVLLKARIRVWAADCFIILT